MVSPTSAAPTPPTAPSLDCGTSLPAERATASIRRDAIDDNTWQRVAQTTVYWRWNEPGQILEGTWIGAVSGKFGPRGQVEQEDGALVVFPLHAVLERALARIAPETEVRIVYTGLLRSAKTGRQYKAFQVFTK